MAPRPVNPVHLALSAGLFPNATQPPLFNHEGSNVYAMALAHNAPFAKPGPYQTTLSPAREQAFRSWITAQKIPFDPNAKTVDYDMRGYFAATNGGTHAQGAHFPDTFKTPYDSTFSNESKFARPGTPFVWKGNTLVDVRTGAPVFKP